MRFARVEDWLDWQARLNPKGIDLGLARVARVWRALGAPRPAPHIVLVAGTNGKGSCVRLLEGLFGAAGYRVGSYTSPHLWRYHERIRVAGRPIDDEALLAAFDRVDCARGEVPLTYFEFGTLAALDHFARAGLDLAVLEVGMGGRLDATNIVDPDVAVVTSIGLDHTEFLGPDREHVAAEKLGIARPGRPLVYGERDAPDNLETLAAAAGARLLRQGRDFELTPEPACWWWRAPGAAAPIALPAADVHPDSAAAALAAAECLRPLCPWPPEARAAALRDFSLPGRCQRVLGAPELWFDVAHNAEAVAHLAARLAAEPRPCEWVFGLLADKPLDAILDRLQGFGGRWWPCTADSPRARPAARLADALVRRGLVVGGIAEAPEAAFRAARAAAAPEARIVVFGSFHVVAPVWTAHESAAASGV
ncbi:MAG: bifunctional folylpolyglutamate synthase/dihydrofolate synthase [Gammaproteobacteria bacterium]|nr:MAG: bifunctional folylpolyglutamate synthase/dihydrofolate synthase [Gammaproteobacteria bacterium]